MLKDHSEDIVLYYKLKIALKDLDFVKASYSKALTVQCVHVVTWQLQ